MWLFHPHVGLKAFRFIFSFAHNQDWTLWCVHLVKSQGTWQIFEPRISRFEFGHSTIELSPNYHLFLIIHNLEQRMNSLTKEKHTNSNLGIDLNQSCYTILRSSLTFFGHLSNLSFLPYLLFGNDRSHRGKIQITK